MAWHIFKKDLILLWPVAALCVLAQAGLAALMFAADAQPDVQALMLAVRLAVAVVFLTVVFSVAFAVHQEPMPGTRQDWLVRPVRRLDLLLAKLLFVLLVVHLPMLACDLLGALARGFSLGEALAPALARNLNLFGMITLPALGLAAMTRNAAEFLVAGVAYLVLAAAGTIVLNVSAHLGGQEQATNPLFWTGVSWIAQSLQRAAVAAGAIVALALLYSQRRVMMARSLFALFAVASVLAIVLPWGGLFAAQQAVAAASGPAPDLALDLAFDPTAPRYRPALGEALDAYSVGAAQVQLRGRSPGDIAVENQARKAQGDVTVFIPLRLNALPAGARLWADRATVRLTSRTGEALFQGKGDSLKLAGDSRAYEAIRLPALTYEAVKDRPLDLDIGYSLSVLEPRGAQAARALDGEVRLAGFGRCTTGRDSDGDEVELRCITAGGAPSCVSTTLEDPVSGRRNPETLLCAPDYAPYVLRPFPDALSRFEVETPFRDRLGLARYPVSGEALGRARVLVVRYDAAAHLTRQVTAKGVHLGDWTPTRP